MPTSPTPEFNALLAQAEVGDAEAQYQVGYAYRRGNPHYGVVINLEHAFKWFERATAKGHSNAQFNLGLMYQWGEFVTKNEETGLNHIQTALSWLKTAADAGNSVAQCNIGVCHIYGYGVDKDEKQAFKWLKQSAEQEYAQAQFNVGACYARGEGVERDEKQAFKWLKQSAEQGEAAAQLAFGGLYTVGYGIKKDENQAFYWFKKSARQGNAKAQYYLGMCYKNGEGTNINLSEAINWFKKASEQGDTDAKNILGDYSDIVNTSEQSNDKSLHLDTDDTIQKAFQEYISAEQNLIKKSFEELIDTQQKQFQEDMQKHNTAFETKINKEIAEFQNQKSTIIENAKKDLEKHGNFSLAVFTGVSIAITLAFIGVMASFSMSSFDGLRSELQAQFDSPKLKIERIDALQKEVELLKTKLKAVEQKNNKPIPPNTN
jgi:TPR repeat protein